VKAPSLEEIDRNTFYAVKSVDSQRARLAAYDSDKDRDRRRVSNLCAACYYFRIGGVGGRAMTDRDCECCGSTVTYTSTNTMRFCSVCADALHVCRLCGADAELESRISVAGVDLPVRRP